MEEKNKIEERKNKIKGFFKNSKLSVYLVLIVLLVLGVYIRVLPMTDHDGTPGLWDITTSSWTLGPDLDPWLFLRQAKTVIETGEYPKIDMMRNVPLGFDNSKETMLLPYMIDWTYHVSKIFYSETTPEFAGVIFPVIMFFLTIIAFFLFVREIFHEENESKADWIALISTLFMIVFPVFLSRTIAGIPEKESAAFFLIFTSFYLFLKAYRSPSTRGALIYGSLAGITTSLTNLIWGGVIFLYITIALATLLSFALNKIHKKQIIAYSFWFVLSILITLTFSNKESIVDILTSLSSGLAFLVLIILYADIILWKNNTFSNKFKDSKISKQFISIIATFMFILVLALIFLGPGFVIEKIKAVHQTIFKPIYGRWGTTVAENRQPYFNEWAGSFGPNIGSIPLTFLLFIIGSIVLFYNLLKEFNIRQKIELTFAYIFLISAMIFTRFSNESIFNGENFISMFVYYLGVFVFVYFLFRIYSKDSKSERKMEKLNFSYILLFSLFLLGIFSARGAIRLVMVLAPIASVFIGYIIIESFVKFKEANKESASMKGVFFILILIISVFSLVSNYREITAISYNMVPTSYNQQWQKAMSWVREETPENSVFGHWWDYGYWVQSIGDRATVLDGGNAITFWNYYMGRLVLTGDNQDDALEFLYAHNTTHLLIDSSDIGKYGAFSIIGSDENFDRYSWISTMLIDEGQTQENSDSIVYVYTSGIVSDEDLIVYEDDKEILLPGKKTLIIGSVLTYNKEVKTFIDQPYIVAFYNGKQYQVKVRNIYIQDKRIEFDEGIDATLYIFPSIVNNGEGGRINDIGAIMYLSPRVMEGMLAQKYILDDPYDEFPNFKLVHVESSEVVNMIKAQGLSSSEFIYYGNTVQGPIKIWEIEYNGDEEFKQEYLETDSSKYLNWDL